ncbi:sulfotransferase family protein [Vannielia litorea]|uniref:Sulfotransferase family protein n=1 Tax=Vannielia litorea TaxID=1217970 RepID=A0A1N6FSR2_9RHOB|nr:sulfotransferase [Vannielia litorea]SIN98304.1 Sulfotransferase family protein [Vannielia litorea]
MGERATLLYGIGAPRTGTSWLYGFLDAHPQCAMPVAKEMHYWDTVEGMNPDWQKDAVVAQIGRLRDRIARVDSGEEEGRLPRLRRRLRQMERWLAVLVIGARDPRAYVDILYEGAEDAKLVADITPAYCLLPQKRLREMAEVVPETRFLFLMRDPVDRYWSQCRFMAGRRAARAGQGNTEEVARQLLDKALRGENADIAQRGDYTAVLAKLAALPKERVMCGFYEDLFKPGSVRALCDFLGIDRVKVNLNEKVNAGPEVELDEPRRAALQRMLAPQYAAVAEEMGALPEAWQRNMERV